MLSILKKISVVLLALILVFAFAACGKNDTAPTQAATVKSDAEKEQAKADIVEGTTVVVTEVATEVVTNAEGETEVVTEIVTEVVEDEHFNSVDPEKIAVFYETAVQKTKDDRPKGHQTMTLAGKISGDGAIGTILKVLEPAVDKALAKNSKETDWVPGANDGALLGSDIKDCYAKTENGKTTVYIELKSQTDGSDCDSNTAGPVARGMSTLGSIDGALSELGAELTSGRETVSLTYRDAYIECVVDEATGKIVSGTWHYVVDVNIGNAQAKLGIPANLKNLKASIEYQVEI